MDQAITKCVFREKKDKNCLQKKTLESKLKNVIISLSLSNTTSRQFPTCKCKCKKMIISYSQLYAQRTSSNVNVYC